MAKFDMYAEVTARIIKALEDGIIPWEKPWVGCNGAWSRAKEGKHYSLINQFLLPSGEYATMERIKSEGGHVLKGSKAKQVWKFYFKRIEGTNEETGEIEVKLLPRCCYFNVFNIATDTDLEVKYHRDEFVAEGVEPLEVLENVKRDYVQRSGVSYHEAMGDEAYYNPCFDAVVVPKREQFSEQSEFYSTVFHELAHSTGHHTRLNRIDPATVMPFGSDDYSREELCAELTACAVLANHGVETSASFRNNAGYIQNWVNALKEDSKAIIRAAAKAEAAYNVIMGIETSYEDESADK